MDSSSYVDDGNLWMGEERVDRWLCFHCRAAVTTHQKSYYEIFWSDGRVSGALLVCRSPWGL